MRQNDELRFYFWLSERLSISKQFPLSIMKWNVVVSTLSRHKELLAAQNCSSCYRLLRGLHSSCTLKRNDEKWKTMSFEEGSATGFESIKTYKLLRAAMVIKLSSNDYIANNAISVSIAIVALLTTQNYNFCCA